MAINPFYLNFAFRIRSDLIATTFFLLFVYTRVLKNILSIKFDIAFMLIFPLIGLKHVFFSIMVASIALTNGRKFNLAVSKYYVFVLGCLTVLVWIISLGWDSATYYLSTIESYKDNLSYLILWFKNDALLLAIGILPLAVTVFSKFESLVISKLRFLHVATIFYFILVSQKFSFFIASLIPIFFLSTFTGILVFIERIKSDLNAKVIVSLIGVAYFSLALYNFKNYFPYHSNSDQLTFVRTIAPILHDQQLSVLDGTGIFPRVRNWKCFYSPDDTKSTLYCKDLIAQSKPPVIILTGRLLNLVSGDAELEKLGYQNVGAGIFLLKNISSIESLNFQKMPAAATTFGLEY